MTTKSDRNTPVKPPHAGYPDAKPLNGPTVKEQMMNLLEQSNCGMFATRETTSKAFDYGLMLLKASSPEEREMAWITASGVYANTVLKVLQIHLESME